MYFLKGVNGQIELRKNRVVISRKGLLGFATQGLAGDKEIPVKNITAVQFKEPSKVTNGYIQFSMLGGVEARGGISNATQDENTVMFAASHAEEFRILKRYIDSVIDDEPMDFESLGLPMVAATQSASQQVSMSQPATGSKSTGVAYLLWFLTGGFGGHRFYLGEAKTGAIMLGLTIISIAIAAKVPFLILIPALWVLIDAFLIPGLVRKANAGAAAA